MADPTPTGEISTVMDRLPESFNTLDIWKALSPQYVNTPLLPLNVQAAMAFSSIPQPAQLSKEMSLLDGGIAKLDPKSTIYTESLKESSDLQTHITNLSTNQKEKVNKAYQEIKELDKNIRDHLTPSQSEKNKTSFAPGELKKKIDEVKTKTNELIRLVNEYIKEYNTIVEKQNFMRLKLSKNTTLEATSVSPAVAPKLGSRES